MKKNVKHKSLKVTKVEDKKDRVAVQAFIKLSELWGVTQLQQCTLLGDSIDRTTITRWKNQIKEGVFKGRLNKDQMERIAHLLSIHKALRLIYPYKELAYSWIKRKNDDFGSNTPLEFLTAEGGMSELIEVQNYLDNVRGGYI